jgi:hypothetical protein
MKVTPSAFRNNLYNLLDQVIEQQEPLWIERNGHLLKVVCEPPPGKLSRLVTHTCMNVDPEELVHTDWSGEWKHDLP